MANESKVICTNVFKNKDQASFIRSFNLKWIELVNKLVKGREAT